MSTALKKIFVIIFCRRSQNEGKRIQNPTKNKESTSGQKRIMVSLIVVILKMQFI